MQLRARGRPSGTAAPAGGIRGARSPSVTPSAPRPPIRSNSRRGAGPRQGRGNRPATAHPPRPLSLTVDKVIHGRCQCWTSILERYPLRRAVHSGNRRKRRESPGSRSAASSGQPLDSCSRAVRGHHTAAVPTHTDRIVPPPCPISRAKPAVVAPVPPVIDDDDNGSKRDTRRGPPRCPSPFFGAQASAQGAARRVGACRSSSRTGKLAAEDQSRPPFAVNRPAKDVGRSRLRRRPEKKQAGSETSRGARRFFSEAPFFPSLSGFPGTFSPRTVSVIPRAGRIR